MNFYIDYNHNRFKKLFFYINYNLNDYKMLKVR